MIRFLALIAALSAAAPQQSGRPAEQITIGSAWVIGIVTDARTGLPISGAKVTISGSSRPPEADVITDGDGQFVFSRVAAGRYGLNVKRGGYFDGGFGQRQPLDPVSTFTLAEGERRSGIAIALVKPAAVTGTILDESGEPVVKLTVRAFSREYLGGRPHYAVAGEGVTDDRGTYRIGRLVAGDYIVGVPLTRPRGLPGEDEDKQENGIPRDGGAVSQLPPAANGHAQVFPAAYFPSGVAAPYATAVSVDFGDVRRNMDLQVRVAPAFRLSGVALLPPGAKRGVRVRLSTLEEQEFAGAEVASMVLSDSGAFATGGLAPGQYVLSIDTPEAWASEVVSIADADLSNVRLVMRDPLKVAGRLAFEGSQPNPEAQTVQNLQLTVERADGLPILNKPQASIDRSGSNFEVKGLTPGRYVVRMARGMPNWYLKSVSYQGRDVSQSAFEITSSDVAGLVATFTDRPASVAGTIIGQTETSDITVFVFPQDPQRWLDFGPEGRAFRAVDVRNGSFEVPDLPAGDYILVALAASAAQPWRQPSFLQPASRAGTIVRVTEGTVTKVDAKVSVIR